MVRYSFDVENLLGGMELLLVLAPSWSEVDLPLTNREELGCRLRHSQVKSACVQALCDGARRIRTADLLGAIQALCQLSYSPAFEAPGSSSGLVRARILVWALVSG